MVKVVELKGNSQVFTLTDGTTFRIFARKSKECKSSLISDEMKRAVKMGLIRLIPVEKKPVTTEEVPVEVPVTKKAGGAK